MRNNKLTVITINHNNIKGILYTIESIRRQTRSPDEWIIVDNESKDGFVDQASKLQKEFHYLKIISEPDAGIYDAMNKGIKISNSDYTIFLNSGDVLHDNNTLDTLIASLSKNFPDIILGGFIYKNKYFGPKPIWWRYISIPTSHQAILYKTSLLKQEMFDDNFKIAGDYEHFLRIIRKYRPNCVFLKKPICTNEPYGCEGKINETKKEYLKALSLYTPPVIAKIAVSLKFTSILTRLSIHKERQVK